MELEEIIKWVDKKGTYEEGVIFYRAIFPKTYLADTFFARPQSSYTYNKLFGELKAYSDKHKQINSVPTISPQEPVSGFSHINAMIHDRDKKLKSLSNENFFKLPKELQEARLDISRLYKDVLAARFAIKAHLNLPSKGKITLDECFHIMNQTNRNQKGIPFDLVWVTCNEETKLGGEVKNLRCSIKYGNKSSSRYKAPAIKDTLSRDPRHDIHGTINVQIENTIELRKVHTWLIFQINGYDVELS